MPKRILIQLDCDPQPSTFDSIVAVDAGVDVLLRHGGVTPESAVGLVHGAMFTRAVSDLSCTAIFVGGSDVAVADAVAASVRRTFFGPFHVGVLVDPAGANTTAAAAVLSAFRHLPRGGKERALVLGGAGTIGKRVARLLARCGLHVTIASRSLERATKAAESIREHVPGAQVKGVESHGTALSGSPLVSVLESADLVIAAGAAKASLLDEAGRARVANARVLIDLNAVPPTGIHGIVVGDKGRVDGKTYCYGALGVGGTKMTIHRAALKKIFEDPTASIDAEECLVLGDGAN